MKQDVKKKSINYYEKIKSEALKKIACLSYNQSYYNDSEVQHLQTVVNNCDSLIHQRQPNLHLPQQRSSKTFRSHDHRP